MEEEDISYLFGGDEFESKGDDLIELLSSSLEDRTTVDESINMAVRCEPVIDFLRAKVFIDAADTSSVVDVYGDIRILNQSGLPKDIIVYERNRFDSLRIYPDHNFLQLCSPDEIPALATPFVVVDIKNVDTGDVIASGRKRLLKTTHKPSHISDFERITTLNFHGDGGHVELQYAAFTFGVYAQVQIFLYKDDDPSESHKDVDDDEQGVEIFGMICAKCNPLLLPKECYENHMFNVIEEEYVWVELGTQIPLFKNLVALPAYSDLEISVDMRLRGYEDDGFIVRGTACFQPGNFTFEWKDIRGVNGFYVRVEVTYCEPSLLNLPFGHEDRVDYVSSVPRFPQFYASQILEVFSLFIARPNCKEVNLYGTVKIIDAKGCCTIFSCSKNEAYFLSRDCNFLPMQGPKRVVNPGKWFSIKIDLSDVDGLVKIKGFAESNCQMEELQRPWFDRRLCSVVRGANDKSFAAIYYTLFSSAVQASLTVRRMSKCTRSSARVKIYGDITASYPKVLSSTSYDKQFFRIILFTRNEVNPLEGEENFQLSRNFLAVPIDFSLRMEANLYFQTSEGTHHVQKIMKLQIGEPYIAIESDYVDIFIDVKWKGLPYV